MVCHRDAVSLTDQEPKPFERGNRLGLGERRCERYHCGHENERDSCHLVFLSAVDARGRWNGPFGVLDFRWLLLHLPGNASSGCKPAHRLRPIAGALEFWPWDSVITLLRDLVAIDSVNPSLVPGGAGEAAVAARIAEALQAGGIDVELTDVAPGRPNVVGVVEGDAPGRALILRGHTDTVGVEGMTAPFDPVVRDGRLYGRGSQDMKNGVAAMVDAAVQVVRNGGLPRGRLVVAAAADEEHASAVR